MVKWFETVKLPHVSIVFRHPFFHGPLIAIVETILAEALKDIV
jgi:hypothetical protein